MRGIGVAALAILVATTPVSAQEPARPDTTHGGMMREGMHCPMMQGMMGGGQGMMPMSERRDPMERGLAFGPAELLARKAVLGLTAQQEARLSSLRDAAEAGHDTAATGAKKHLEALAQSMAAAAPDLAEAKRHFEAARAAGGAGEWAMLRAAAQAKATLTDTQRGRVEGWSDARQMSMAGGMKMMGGMDKMNMDDCPIMKGGMHGDSRMPLKEGS
ncbi:MAG: hypothetical protein ACREMO_03060 [Gemmatimonadales bacterium]